MLVTVAILTSLGVLAALGALAWVWLSASWEVVDDERIPQRLAGVSGDRHGIIRSWFGLKPRMLTYRRDRQGRFRRHKR